MKLITALLLATLTASAWGMKLTAMPALPPTQGPSVALNCTAGAANGSAAANSFNFYRSTTSGGPYTLLGSASSCAYTDTTVTFNTTYYYVSTGVNTLTCPSQQTCESGYSNQATAVVGVNPVPNPPTGLTVGTIVAETVPLNWSPPVPQSGVTVKSYNVYNCHIPTCPSPPLIATTTATAYTALCGYPKACYFMVRANSLVNGKTVQSGPSNVVKVVAQ
jgi:hypothetical protein